jgi:hypothetical protein
MVWRPLDSIFDWSSQSASLTLTSIIASLVLWLHDTPVRCPGSAATAVRISRLSSDRASQCAVCKLVTTDSKRSVAASKRSIPAATPTPVKTLSAPDAHRFQKSHSPFHARHADGCVHTSAQPMPGSSDEPAWLEHRPHTVRQVTQPTPEMSMPLTKNPGDPPRRRRLDPGPRALQRLPVVVADASGALRVIRGEIDPDALDGWAAECIRSTPDDFVEWA